MISRYFPLYLIVFFATLSLTVILERALIPFLKEHAKQPIYEGGPKWHVAKSGTPTMGGAAFLIASTVALSIASFVFIMTGEGELAASLILALVREGCGLTD